MPELVGSNYFLVETALRIEKRVERGSKDLDPVFEDRGSEFNNCFFMSYTRDTFVYLCSSAKEEQRALLCSLKLDETGLQGSSTSV